MSISSNIFSSTATRRGVGALVGFIIIWYFGARVDDWTGYDVLGIGLVPPPGDVFPRFWGLFQRSAIG